MASANDKVSPFRKAAEALAGDITYWRELPAPPEPAQPSPEGGSKL